MKGRLSKKLTAGMIALGVALAASVAFAAWTATGTGSGYTQATTASVLSTVDVSASTTAQLYPGGTSDVKIEISNPNPYAVTVTSVVGSGTITSNKGAACDASTGVTFTDQTGQSIVVPAGGTTATTFAGAAAMSNASDNTCQGAIFTIPVTLSGASS
jgi:nitrogen regulatory protein PII